MRAELVRQLKAWPPASSGSNCCAIRPGECRPSRPGQALRPRKPGLGARRRSSGEGPDLLRFARHDHSPAHWAGSIQGGRWCAAPALRRRQDGSNYLQLLQLCHIGLAAPMGAKGAFATMHVRNTGCHRISTCCAAGPAGVRAWAARQAQQQTESRGSLLLMFVAQRRSERCWKAGTGFVGKMVASWPELG